MRNAYRILVGDVSIGGRIMGLGEMGWTRFTNIRVWTIGMLL
jgi:hypothetical protein